MSSAYPKYIYTGLESGRNSNSSNAFTPGLTLFALELEYCALTTKTKFIRNAPCANTEAQRKLLLKMQPFVW
jgi:hypothetical protein